MMGNSLIDLLITELEEEIAELKSQQVKLWQFARLHSGKSDAQIAVATGVPSPFEKKERM